MAENTTVHIGENSPEQVALKLLELVSRVEKRALYAAADGNPADRAWILNTYAECLETVRGYRDVLKK